MADFKIGPRVQRADLLHDRVINGTLYRFVNFPERIFALRNPPHGVKVHEWRKDGE